MGFAEESEEAWAAECTQLHSSWALAAATTTVEPVPAPSAPRCVLSLLADHLWWPDPEKPWHLHISNHPNKAAPRCLPCHFDDSGFNRSAMPFPAPKG